MTHPLCLLDPVHDGGRNGELGIRILLDYLDSVEEAIQTIEGELAEFCDYHYGVCGSERVDRQLVQTRRAIDQNEIVTIGDLRDCFFSRLSLPAFMVTRL